MKLKYLFTLTVGLLLLSGCQANTEKLTASTSISSTETSSEEVLENFTLTFVRADEDVLYFTLTNNTEFEMSYTVDFDPFQQLIDETWQVVQPKEDVTRSLLVFHTSLAPHAVVELAQPITDYAELKGELKYTVTLISHSGDQEVVECFFTL